MANQTTHATNLDLAQNRAIVGETLIGDYCARRGYSPTNEEVYRVFGLLRRASNSDKQMFIGYVRLNPLSGRWSIRTDLFEKWYLIEYSSMSRAVETLQFITSMRKMGVLSVKDITRYAHNLDPSDRQAQCAHMVCACRVYATRHQIDLIEN